MKTCIFIVGDRSSGKSTIIKRLTKCNEEGVWDVQSKSSEPLTAFVLLSAIAERGLKKKKHYPYNFPSSLEEEKGVKREDYDMLICPFEIRTGLWKNKDCSIDKYIQKARDEDFEVKVAIIEQSYGGNAHDLPQKLEKTKEMCIREGVTPLPLDANQDESRKIRENFYPR